MALIPNFEMGVWNAWIFIAPYIFMNFGLPFLLTAFKNRKNFWEFPSYTGLDRMCFLLYMVLMGGLSIYSVFLSWLLAQPGYTPVSLSIFWGLLFLSWLYQLSSLTLWISQTLQVFTVFPGIPGTSVCFLYTLALA
jgi:hypothetical protein